MSSGTDDQTSLPYPDSLNYDGLLFTKKQQEAKTLLTQRVSHITENSPSSEWMQYAACKGKTGEFFRHTCTRRCASAPKGCHRLKSVQTCHAICEVCPVLYNCRVWALSSLPVGFAGGMTESEREKLALSLGVVTDE